MKKLTLVVLALVMCLAMAACGSGGGDDYAGQVSGDLNELNLYVDGADVTDGNVTFDSLKDSFDVVEVDGVSYYAAALTDLCEYDLSTVVGFFGETTDGFVRYYNTLENAYIAVLESEDGENFEQIMNEDTPAYGIILPEGNIIYGAQNIYMVTTPAEFDVAIQVNGEEIGRLTMDQFMMKTPVGEEKVTTGMYDASFMYKMGQATYEGRFLGIDYETMLAKLAALNMPIEGEITEVEFYGTPGMGMEGKNAEYALYPDEDNYFGNVSFFCMYDGMTNNTAIKDIPVGLTAFIDGTGQKWVTYGLTTMNFITK